MKTRLSWILVPFVLLAAAEFVVRKLDANSFARASWYEGASDRARRGEVDHIFIGTSRTASAIRPGVWESEFRKESEGPVHCLNLGRAFSGPVAHHFALREMLRRHPEVMEKSTVFLELSAGLPAFSGGWSDRWFFPGNIQLVVDYMSRPDLWRFLRTEHSFEEKASVLARYLGRPSALVRGRRQLQQQFDWRANRYTRRIVDRFGGRASPQDESGLPVHRQLRTDRAGITLQRDLVIERTSAETLARQEPLRPWSERVVCETADMLRAHGTRVVFHDMPAPSYVHRVNDTPTRRADRADFGAWLDERAIPVLESGIQVSDEDFPDLSHLRAARIDEYTQRLARAYVASRP